MDAPRQIERDILLSLHRYSMLTTDQLGLLLHYQPKTVHNTFRPLRSRGWLESLSLEFLTRNVKGWVLTKTGMRIAYDLAKEERKWLLRQSGFPLGQSEHLYGSNRFFTDLIRQSLTRPAQEGLVEWIGMRDSGDRYPIFNRKQQRTTPLRPDGIGIYQFVNGSEAVFHVEYDTGSERLWILRGKLWNYREVLKTFWADITCANVLFITRDSRRSERILELWQGIRNDVFRNQPTPTIWTAAEDELVQRGPFAPVLQGIESKAVSFLDFPRLSGGNGDRSIPLGKQFRKKPFTRTKATNSPSSI
ncbi:replication-relaxation family protein [Alicyclobacillus fodiniaquatilis]|uniref:Replication-relaxation family protein n=1 Tax=Alicyclobacillus fodiniaquatilis TaxID=1661150 RepID=A0ABW4JH88_9BACL